MDDQLHIVGVIPARSGSKGVESKNLLKLGDETLIERTVRVSSGSDWISEIIFSTDDKKYADLAIKAGATKVVFRPQELSNDTAKSWDVVRHAIKTTEADSLSKADVVVLLQPTTPLRTIGHIDKVIEKIVLGEFEAAMTIREISYPAEWMFRIDEYLNAHHIIGNERQISRRQEARKTFQPAGTAYAVKRSRLFLICQ